MSGGQWFSLANTLLCAGAMVCFAWERQWPTSLYWFGAVVINVAVLWRTL